MSVDLPSIAALDGSVLSDGTVTTSGGGPLVGDLDGTPPGPYSRQFYTFDRSLLPAGATVTSATLFLYQERVANNPYTVHGNVVVDYLNYGGSLDFGDFGVAAIQAGFGTLSSTPAIEWKSLDVTSQVRDAVGAGRNPQFRLSWSNAFYAPNGMDDWVQFPDAEDSCCGNGHLPRIQVTYTN